MNFISTIATHIAQGLTAAESAVKIEAEHGVQVTEDWVHKIMGADGFAHALAEAKAMLAKAETKIEGIFTADNPAQEPTQSPAPPTAPKE